MNLSRIDNWEAIYSKECLRRKHIYESTLKITTNDSWTLTDGPTIYLTSMVQTIANYCLKIVNIPPSLMKELMINLDYNSQISLQIASLEKDLEDKTMKDNDKETKSLKKMMDSSDKPQSHDATQTQIQTKIDILKDQIRTIVLPDGYIPNTEEHKQRFKATNANAFTPTIDPTVLEKVMALDVEEGWKLLMMMGIGIFAPQHTSYMEIMKDLASKQYLFMIIADTDYIYGTNYQFCHAYLGKDLENMTQEKLIQAMGRVGRGKLQQTYSVRFRNSYGATLFLPSTNRPEVEHMRNLFVSI